MPLNKLLDSGEPLSLPDVQRTTLGLDVLSRFVCNTWDEAIASGARPFDAIVIGSGMFGGYCAEKIYRVGAERGLRVLVLDAGPFLVPTHIQNLPRCGLNVPGPMLPTADSGKPRELVWGMPWRSNVEFVGQAFCVGGKSLYWGGWCPRLLDDDLAGWPKSVASYLKANYPTIERQTGVDVKADFIHGDLFDRLRSRFETLASNKSIANVDRIEDAPLAVQGQAPASGIFGFDKFSSLTLLIDAVREGAGQSDDSRRLFVVPNAHVTHLQLEGRRVTRLDAVVDGVPRSLSVSADCSVILAAGTTESTRLALSSFPTSPDPKTELMGRNLMGHVRTNVYMRIRRSALDPQGSLPKALETAALLVRGSTLAGKFHLQVTACADPNNNSDALLYTMIPDIDQLTAILKMQDAEWVSVAFRGVSEMKGDIATWVPNGTGRWINLSPFEKDEFGVPRAYVQLSTTAEEDALADAMDAAILAIGKALASGNSTDMEVMSKTRDPLGSTYHEAGTLWMGEDPKLSVTDPNGRFHHVDNAYCADQSLFVTVGSVNPVLTGLVLARKVAEAVVARRDLVR